GAPRPLARPPPDDLREPPARHPELRARASALTGGGAARGTADLRNRRHVASGPARDRTLSRGDRTDDPADALLDDRAARAGLRAGLAREGASSARDRGPPGVSKCLDPHHLALRDPAWRPDRLHRDRRDHLPLPGARAASRLQRALARL